MSTSLQSLDDAFCSGCGYRLRGLPTAICPECGKAFDPTDASTFRVGVFDQRWVWAKRIEIVLLVGAIVFAIVPRGLLRASAKFTCADCGLTHTVSRWQLEPPRWIRFRYPGSTASSHSSATRACQTHQYSVSVLTDLPVGGNATATISSTMRIDYVEDPGVPATLMGVVVTPETGDQILFELLAPGNNRIGP